jgi:hypothetical protein
MKRMRVRTRRIARASNKAIPIHTARTSPAYDITAFALSLQPLLSKRSRISVARFIALGVSG